MKYGEFKQHINRVRGQEETLAPAYVICGDDDYLKYSVIKAFKETVDPEFSDFNLSIISVVDGTEINAAIDALYTFPMFAERKVVILSVSDAFSDEEWIDAVNKYLISPSDTSTLVIDGAGGCANSIKSKRVQFIDCSHLDDSALILEINEIAKTSPAKDIDRDAATELIVRTQGNMSRIINEMLKLKAYVDVRITKKDVEDMVSADIDFQIYELANAVSEHNADKALQALDVFFKNGIKGVTIINRLYDKYRNMLHAELNKNLNNDEMAKLLGMKSGAVYYLRKTSSNYSQIRLKKSVDYLHNLQNDVLTGKRNDISAIHEAILELLAI